MRARVDGIHAIHFAHALPNAPHPPPSLTAEGASLCGSPIAGALRSEGSGEVWHTPTSRAGGGGGARRAGAPEAGRGEGAGLGGGGGFFGSGPLLRRSMRHRAAWHRTTAAVPADGRGGGGGGQGAGHVPNGAERVVGKLLAPMKTEPPPPWVHSVHNPCPTLCTTPPPPPHTQGCIIGRRGGGFGWGPLLPGTPYGPCRRFEA